ncbi:MAG: hypothetical protein ACQEWD_11395 [Bacteroidota bacterium]
MNFKPQTISLTDQERREAVVNILTDAIILDRIYYGISLLNTVGTFNSENETSWDVIDQINSYCNAFPLMGISDQIRDEDLSMKLAEVFNNTYRKEMEPGFTKDAKIVAEHIYTEWLDIVIRHNREAFTNSKKAS